MDSYASWVAGEVDDRRVDGGSRAWARLYVQSSPMVERCHLPPPSRPLAVLRLFRIAHTTLLTCMFTIKFATSFHNSKYWSDSKSDYGSVDGLLEKNTFPRYYVSSSHRYQHILHRNLIYLATIADATPPSTQKTVD
ncbi:PREDICTED: SS18-like protein 2 [Pygoscelis adeliae]|uniref:SS18-like protein 2 n=1 Tax=Pygoscelis adeliae TaxID=9238 RepID=UPI0004F4E7C5|nr:PREDICTED: SS18-like protein 2 [Pygoscelis adeliae]